MNESKGMAITSMVLGIIGMVCCCIPFLDLILSVTALVLGIVCVTKHKPGKEMAIAGIVLGSIGTILGFRVSALIFISGATFGLMDELFGMGGFPMENPFNLFDRFF